MVYFGYDSQYPILDMIVISLKKETELAEAVKFLLLSYFKCWIVKLSIVSGLTSKM